MEIEKYKILETDFNGKGVSAQPNPMQKTEEEAKAVFDELVKDVVTPKHNDLVEALKPIDLTSDKDKPVSDAQKKALDKKVDKELRTGSTEKYKVLTDNNYSDEERDRVYNTLAKDNDEPFDPTGEYHPATKKYVDDKVLESGNADMAQAVYDPKGEKKDMFAHERLKDNPHGVTVAQVGGCNPNLVENAYFGNPVNQRGLSVYDTSSSAAYVFDRWWSIFAKSTLLDGRVLIESTHGSYGGAVRQPLSFPRRFVGKKATLSILVKNMTGTGSVGLVRANGINSGMAVVCNKALSAGMNVITADIPDDVGSETYPMLMVSMSSSVGGSLEVVAVKLELGTEQTLAHQDENGNWVLNEIPNYAEQMAICKQYDPVSGAYIGLNYFPFTGGTIDGFISLNDQSQSGFSSGRVFQFAGGLFLEAKDRDWYHRRLAIQNKEVAYIGSSLVLVDENADGTRVYNLFGEHNKPSGTYTGTNSNREYAIDTGGVGNLLFISSEYAFGWAMPDGAVFFRGSSSSAYHFTSGIKYKNGVLTISNSTAYFNSSSYEYTWRCV